MGLWHPEGLAEATAEAETSAMERKDGKSIF